MTYAQAAADPLIPVITKDDYIEWLEERLGKHEKTRKALRSGILKLVDGYAELP